MMTTNDWARWEASWRDARATPAELGRMIERTRRAARALMLVRVFSAALAVAALAVVGLALRHAGNPLEAALGLAVAVGIVTAWHLDAVNRAGSAEKADAPPADYARARRALCQGQLRFTRLAWIVVALDLVFLIPWWIGGLKVHGAALNATQVGTIWGPLATMFLFVAWTFRLRRRASAELAALARQERAVDQD